MLLLAQSVSAKNYIKPDKEFLNSIVLIRAGVQDLGDTTVTDIVEMFKTSIIGHGKSPVIKGWVKTTYGYSLEVVMAKQISLDFMWDGRSSLLRPIIINYHNIPAILFLQAVSDSQ